VTLPVLCKAQGFPLALLAGLDRYLLKEVGGVA